MQDNSIRRYEIEWAAFRERAFEAAGNAQTPAATYYAIQAALERIGDNHSFFVPPQAMSSASSVRPPGQGAATPAAVDPSVQLHEPNIGYVDVPAFSGSGQAVHELATQYHRLIESIDTLGTCGWVVDLRGNTGGNMWPMVAGVGPILGVGLAGYFVDPDSVIQPWSYEAGSSWIGTFEAAIAEIPYVLVQPDPPVAVLTDGATASSGEATTISFRGREGARSFGRPTYGLSTANRNFPLSDGATIYLTVSTMADRTGQLYGEKVVPDEIVEGRKTGYPSSDAPLSRALDWLQTQPPCAVP
jgi:C-terminal processing protease CtpA/Prc